MSELKPSLAALLEALNNAYDDEPQMLDEMGFDEPFSELLKKIEWSHAVANKTDTF